METATNNPRGNLWWLKGSRSESNIGGDINKNVKESVSLVDLGYEDGNSDEDVDIDSILEEITRLSAKSPLGPYDANIGDRSIDEIMKEAEKIYLESSKSFEQLSQRSKTSHNISDLTDKSDNSTPTPKSISPLPMDEVKAVEVEKEESDEYSDDFSEASDHQSSLKIKKNGDTNTNEINANEVFALTSDESSVLVNGDDDVLQEEEGKITVELEDKTPTKVTMEFEIEIGRRSQTSINNNTVIQRTESFPQRSDLKKQLFTQQRTQSFTPTLKNHYSFISDSPTISSPDAPSVHFKEEIVKKDEIINLLITDNKSLKDEIKTLETQMDELKQLLEETSSSLKTQNLQNLKSAELNNALEELKDTKEVNTALQVQLDSTNKSHQLLKNHFEDLLVSNKELERRMIDVDATLSKYKAELQSVQKQKEKLIENEVNANKMLELERSQIKNLKQQIDKDSRCILDLNRQIKEMERIIARKHPDSVSALIVAAKNEAAENTPTTRKVLEDRIKILEKDALLRDAQNSQVFIDVQEKFNQMKLKYESHIDDLELHVSDLKTQLKRRVDTYDVYTQTIREEQKIPVKDTSSVYVQTDAVKKVVVQQAPVAKKEQKEETHLLATIRGFQADLSNKEKVIVKLQKEIDELRKTNRRLQKEREGSLRNLTDKKEFRSYPDKLSHASNNQKEQTDSDSLSLDEELRAVRTERDKMKFQLVRIEEDYQALKAKRLQDLNTLQEAHEREVAAYLANVTPLREQLEVQQVTLSSVQAQLVSAKEQLAVVTVERDHLSNKLSCGVGRLPEGLSGDSEVVALRKKIAHLEMRYEERENRLRAIVHGLAQKTVTNRSCEQCAARQQQLIGYKAELDQIIATLRCLQ